jgi:hypothetical protein
VHEVINVDLSMSGWRRAGLPEIKEEKPVVEHQRERIPVA